MTHSPSSLPSPIDLRVSAMGPIPVQATNHQVETMSALRSDLGNWSRNNKSKMDGVSRVYLAALLVRRKLLTTNSMIVILKSNLSRNFQRQLMIRYCSIPIFLNQRLSHFAP